jgi:hypothetical protein
VATFGSGPSAGPVAAAGGEPGILLSPEAGGLTQISVGSSCRAGELVSITYADATLVERLDADGHSKTTRIDLDIHADRFACAGGAQKPIGHRVAGEAIKR